METSDEDQAEECLYCVEGWIIIGECGDVACEHCAGPTLGDPEPPVAQ